jgi:NAD(P)-dependent dehydrogenase (short-subunit alcohol dehydrogenase family)
LPYAVRVLSVLAVAERICLVTGAGRGIGRAVARRLSAAGHRVALTARSADELTATAKDCPGPTLELPADITDPGAPDRLVAAVEEAWGPVGILVANAGRASSAPVHKVTDEEWQRVLDLNLTAPFRCVRRVAPGMVGAGWGRIVVVASVAAKAGDRYMAAYTASKHGVLGMVRSVAAELARAGVTVNAVCPGYVDTPMTDGSVDSIVAATGRDATEVRQILERRQPIGRLVTVDEVADAVDLCVTSGAITGQGINVDGGAVQS